MQCASGYEENHAPLNFIDSATHFLWSTTTASSREPLGSGRPLLGGGKLL